ncbi:MAG: hypothetical protein SVU69_06045 [Pseudomonadota bacterium]|nr:hypothetical protein [Pseudomonadota bacterium]
MIDLSWDTTEPTWKRNYSRACLASLMLLTLLASWPAQAATIDFDGRQRIIATLEFPLQGQTGRDFLPTARLSLENRRQLEDTSHVASVGYQFDFRPGKTAAANTGFFVGTELSSYWAAESLVVDYAYQDVPFMQKHVGRIVLNDEFYGEYQNLAPVYKALVGIGVVGVAALAISNSSSDSAFDKINDDNNDGNDDGGDDDASAGGPLSDFLDEFKQNLSLSGLIQNIDLSAVFGFIVDAIGEGSGDTATP